MLKICLTALTASILIGCNKLPEFPGWNPYVIIPSENKKIQCRLIDKEKLLFECDKSSTELGSTLEGYFATSAEETRAIIRWAQDAKDQYNKTCNRGM